MASRLLFTAPSSSPGLTPVPLTAPPTTPPAPQPLIPEPPLTPHYCAKKSQFSHHCLVETFSSSEPAPLSSTSTLIDTDLLQGPEFSLQSLNSLHELA